jgi:hypothetical protein
MAANIAAVGAKRPAREGSQHANAKDALDERLSRELVFALCGPIGSGLSFVKEGLVNTLRSWGYQVEHVKISDRFAHTATALNITAEAPEKGSVEYRRIIQFQNLGNELRARMGDDVGAQLAIRHISVQRLRDEPKRQLRK